MDVGTDWLRKNVKKIGEGGELVVSTKVAAAVEVEAWLQRHGVKYAPPTGIPMAMIDERRSRQNQARRDPIVAESVERFATALRSGNQFPPIVVYPLGGKLVIIDGNNRQAAARKAGLQYIQGIIIADTTPSEVIQLLTVEANAHHGVTPELGWRLKQAFHLIGLGFKDSEAAEAASVSLLQIKNARSVQQADQRAKAMRVHNFGHLSASVKKVLNALKDDPVFYQAASLAAHHQMGTDEASDLVRMIKAERSEADRIKVIAEYAKSKTIDVATKKAMKSHRVTAPKQALVSGIGLILKCDESALIQHIVTTHDRDEVKKRLANVVDKILAIQVAMEKLDTLDEA